MSTTVELGKATAEIARLRASIERLADDWTRNGIPIDSGFGPAADELLRALLEES